MGRLVAGGFSWESCFLPLESDAARASPRRAERRLIRPDSTQILTTIHYQTFFASKGSVCWWLLVP